MRKRFWYATAWIFSGCVCLISLSIVLLYGISFGPVKSTQWISAYVIALMHKMAILDPVRISLTALWRSYRTKKPPPDYGFHKEFKQPRQLRRIKVRLDYLMERFQKADWTAAKKQSRKTERLLIYYDSVLNDLLMLSFYTMALLLVVLGTKDNLSYYGTRYVEDIFTAVKNKGPSIEAIITEEDLKNYINQTVAIQLHDAESLDANAVKIIGVARLRQHRSRENCSSVSLQKCWINCCRYFIPSKRDMKSYSAGWKPAVPFAYKAEYWRIWQPWQYSSADDSRSLPVFGDSYLYPGGGYIANLGRNPMNSQHILRYLFNSHWIDERTGVLFVEVTFYCANGNLFNLVTVIAERSPFGTFNVNVQIKTAKLLFISTELGSSPWIAFVTFVIMVCMITYRLSRRLIYRESNMQFNVWDYMDAILVLLSMGSVVLFFVRNIYVAQLLNHIEDHPKNEFVSFYYAGLIDDLFSWMSAALVCTATIRLWKILQFTLTFRVLTKSLARSAKSTVFCLIVLIIFEVGISAAFHLINGGNLIRYSTFGKAFVTLLSFAVQLRDNLDTKDMQRSAKSIDIVFYAIQEIVVNIFLLNMLVTIALFYSSDLREEIRRMDSQKYTFWQFLRDEYLHLRESTLSGSKQGASLRLRGGGSLFSRLPHPWKSENRRAPKESRNSQLVYSNEKTALVNRIINSQMDYLDRYIDEQSGRIRSYNEGSGRARVNHEENSEEWEREVIQC